MKLLHSGVSRLTAVHAVCRLGTIASEGTTTRVYDSKGRIKAESRTNLPAPMLTASYTYDSDGNVASIIYPSGRVVNYTRDALGRISAVGTALRAGAAPQTVVGQASWYPFGPISGLTFGNNLHAAFTLDSDYRVTKVAVGPAANPNGVMSRTLSWTGDDVLNSIVDNLNPGTGQTGVYAAQTQAFTYTPARRLASARGYYGTLAWTYDANGDRTSETANNVITNYLYGLASNRLASAASASATRSFTYDAAGEMLTDTRSGALGMTYQYDPMGRLSKAYQTNAAVNSGTYGYDAWGRLASRLVTQSGAAAATTLYIHDTKDHIIAETNAAGVTLREYLWLDDLPVAVVDNVNASPTLYYVHTDHLGRPAKMTTQAQALAWDVIYSPFGATSYIATTPETQNMRFPGQWFQLESGLAYNWHRHYDATLGRYITPDPLGLPALLSDGPSAYNYVGGNPLVQFDRRGWQEERSPEEELREEELREEREELARERETWSEMTEAGRQLQRLQDIENRACPLYPEPQGPRFFRGKLRESIMGDNPICEYCGAPATVVDHIYPWSRGGPTSRANSAKACVPCNSSKRDKTPTEWGGR